jgi:hypothetical protein
MIKLLTTVAVATLFVSGPVAAQESSKMLSGAGITCGNTAASGTSTGTTTESTASTSGAATSTDTTSSTTAATGTTTTEGAAETGTASESAKMTGSTMALSADNQINAETVRKGLGNSQANVANLDSLSTPTVVCIVDVDVFSQSDEGLKADVAKYRSNNAQIKSALEGKSEVLGVIKAQHPSFDLNQVLGTDIGPNGELVLYVSRS